MVQLWPNCLGDEVKGAAAAVDDGDDDDGGGGGGGGTCPVEEAAKTTKGGACVPVRTCNAIAVRVRSGRT